jgi:hypothetical protein
LLLVLLLSLNAGCAVDEFVVTDVRFTIPDWAMEPGMESNVAVHIIFNRALSNPDVITPIPIKVDIEASRSGSKATDIKGNLKWNGDREVVFISNDTISELVAYAGGHEVLYYTIWIDGTQPGAITDHQGVLLDGDKDDNPGGDYYELFLIMPT